MYFYREEFSCSNDPSMKVNRYLFILSASTAAAIILYSCRLNPRRELFPDTDMYDLSRPAVIRLPEALDEISGIAFYPKDSSVFAIIDEDGMLFKIPVKNPANIKTWRFDKQRDYEDLVLLDSVFYVLVSNGDIETIRFNGNLIHTEKADFRTRSKKENEFEAMYYSADSGKLVIVCKDCEEDSKKVFSSFSYGFRDSVKAYADFLQMDVTPVAAQLGWDKQRFKASAAAINPVSEDLYIISSVNHVLIIASKKGRIKEIYKLDPVIYKQPEGICFTPQGDLIISNEFAGTGFAELLVMKNKKKGR